ncbi:hypothetical protein [Picosynechococcus sp. PCC 8807]|uniref:hypothetical protein n=1 Tax=Picosynechococcus sp. PCC 8807 TaxID=195248 RepID=UPI000810E70C|nr:hypothetical protein [Picosynechococcus sp. PCC 8807]ANV90782.1 hypothetical protein AWQ24_09135 [Picosynechococcus sp. PCC 8807]
MTTYPKTPSVGYQKGFRVIKKHQRSAYGRFIRWMDEHERRKQEEAEQAIQEAQDEFNRLYDIPDEVVDL